MHLVVVNILQDLRALYDIPGRMERFHAYVDLVSGKSRGVYLPIGNFSPMGQRQSEYLDLLIRLEAEREAQIAASAASERLGPSFPRSQVILVVVDEPKNGWTQRSLTDASWRFDEQTDSVPKNKRTDASGQWISVQLWTDIEPTVAYIKQEVSSAIYRCAHRRIYGVAKSLREMLVQEGRALAFAGAKPSASEEELKAISDTIAPHLDSQDYPICFGALYGDEAARSVGYDPLGVTANGGFDVAIYGALRDGLPNLSVRSPQSSKSKELT